MKTIAERLDACTAAYPPVRAHDDKNGSPYQILTLDNGNMRIELTNADGDRLGGIGPTLDDAITALEAKLHVTN